MHGIDDVQIRITRAGTTMASASQETRVLPWLTARPTNSAVIFGQNPDYYFQKICDDGGCHRCLR
jgi:hypothetical protein